MLLNHEEKASIWLEFSQFSQVFTSECRNQLFLNNSITCAPNLETYHRAGNSREVQQFRHLKGAVKSSLWLSIIITLKNYLNLS